MRIFQRIGAAGLLTFIIGSAGILPGRSALSDDSTDNYPVSISLKDADLPASDLVYVHNGKREILTPEQAWQLKTRSGVDLSRLDPDATTDIWTGKSSATDDALDAALPIQSGESVKFIGVITSSSGRFKLNVQVQSGNKPAKTLTLMISKDLHTFLLRKELLRRLGYRIPAMKYLPKVVIRFPDAATRDDVLNTMIPTDTYGASSRWCSVSQAVYDQMKAAVKEGSDPACSADTSITDTSSTNIVFQDLLAMEATPLYYNVAIGPPIQVIPNTNPPELRPEGPRLLRALALPYALANVPESVNQTDWIAGRTQSGSVTFPVPDEANFACTLDDAQWVLRRIATLTRDDFARIVAGSYFPEPVAKVLVEKLVSRRNSLLAAFGVSAQQLSFDAQVTEQPALVNGKIMQQDWPGYASRFAYGDPASPLQDLKYYLFSELEGNAEQNLVAEANLQIPKLDTAGAIAQHQQDLYQQAFQQFIKTGQAQQVTFGAWVAPIASGGIDISRGVIMGSYLGTDNLVQLADNFGFHANAGLMIGFDGIPASVPISLQGIVKGTASITLTHLKPLTNLKQAVTEPIQNEVVPWIFYNASKVLQRASAAQKNTTETPDQLKKELADDLSQLKGFMGIGDSLIITESVSGLEGLNASIQPPAPFAPAISIAPAANELIISRLHFYRKDANTILVFQDSGELAGLSITLGFTVGAPAQFPILSLTAKTVAGSGDSKIYTVNVSPDPKNNPDIYANANALAAAMKTDSTEILASKQTPTDISIDFRDSTSWLQFFSYVDRTLRTNGDVTITLPKGKPEKFISMTDGTQDGESYQSFLTQIGTYLVQFFTRSGNFGINTDVPPDPGQSFLGTSQTRDAGFQARVAPEGLSQPFVQVQYRWEGWQISQADMITLVNTLSQKYGFSLYNDGFLNDTQYIQLYELTLNIDFYQAALTKILSMTAAEADSFTLKYMINLGCSPQAYPPPPDKMATLPSYLQRSRMCDALGELRNTYEDGFPSDDPAAKAKTILKVVSDLEQFVDFQDLIALAGGLDDIYVYSAITGFRVGSENLSVPISSNTLGKADIENPDGVLGSAQQILGIEDGEFDMQWIRDKL